MRVLVVGPGALGVLIAARLRAAGTDVMAAARDTAAAQRQPATWTAISERGARVDAAVPIIGRPADLDHPVDVIILATKCQAAHAAAKRWRSSLAPQGVVVALQNGIIGDELVQVVGDRLIECTVAFPATLLAPGISEQTGPGAFILGPWPDARMAPTVPLRPVAELLGQVETTRISDNMQGVKWTKLLINSAITGLGVVTGENLGAIFADQRGRLAAIEIISEGYRAGLDAGIRFEKVAGLHPAWLAMERSGRSGLALRHMILRVMARKYKRQRSSSLQSLERGRATEVAYLNQAIVDVAGRHDRVAPVNGAIVALAEDIEAGRIRPSIELLDRLQTRFH